MIRMKFTVKFKKLNQINNYMKNNINNLETMK